MPDTDQAAQADADTQDAQDTHDAAQPQAGGDGFDRDRAMATIAKLREYEKTAKAQARELETLRAKAQAADDAKLSEQERLQKRIAELEQQDAERTVRMRALAAQSALIAAATKAGALYPDLLADRLAASAELDAEGRTLNADALVADAKKQYPAVFRAQAGSADGGAGQDRKVADGGGGGDMNRMIRHYAGRA